MQQQKQQAVLASIAQSNIQDNVDSMTVRLMQAEEELQKERGEHRSTRERLRAAVLDLEAVPLLQAQVEVPVALLPQLLSPCLALGWVNLPILPWKAMCNNRGEKQCKLT